MSSKSETGHAKNVANFKALIGYCKGYGTKYNPTKAIIKMPALEALLLKAQGDMSQVNKDLTPFDSAVTAREVAFRPLGKLITRVTNALATSEVPEGTFEDALKITRKLQGKRADTAEEETPEEPVEGEEENEDKESKSISASQLSFDNKVANMEKLVEFLGGQPNYIPNETDLTTVSLKALHSTLTAANDKVLEFTTPLKNARIARNATLYDPKTGLKFVAGEVKKYVKSVYGTGTPQFKQVSGIKFTAPKKD